MKKITFLFLISFFALTLVGCTQEEPLTNKNTNMTAQPSVQEQLQNEITKLGHENLLDSYNQAIIKTSLGDIKVELYNEDSPLTVNNFLNLANKDFYNGILFHRVIPDFMIQGGDPLSKTDNIAMHGTGGPGYKFKDEINNHKIVKGSLAMANSGPNTNGSQFFIVTAAATPWLDGMHTNFGQVIEGLDIVDKIEAVKTGANDHPLDDVKIESIELLSK
jgi:cyclophilin family peptidyl-prolyl cis-trans isomerase